MKKPTLSRKANLRTKLRSFDLSLVTQSVSSELQDLIEQTGSADAVPMILAEVLYTRRKDLSHAELVAVVAERCQEKKIASETRG